MWKWLSGIIGSVISGVILWLLVGSPHPPDKPNTSTITQHSGTPQRSNIERPKMRVVCTIKILNRYQQIVNVVATSKEENVSVDSAKVRLEAWSDGVFESTQSTFVTGNTDEYGVFKAHYKPKTEKTTDIRVFAIKSGFIDGWAKCRS